MKSIGETVDEAKKPKKKAKEKVEKSKTNKKEKKKKKHSVPSESEPEQVMEEVRNEVEEEEVIPVKVHNKGVKNKFIEDELKTFKDNFHLIEPGKSMITKGNEETKTFNFRASQGQGDCPGS